MKKVLVFVDYDIIIRHFIDSGAFDELERNYEVTYVFHTDSTSPKRGIWTDVDGLGLKRYTTLELPRRRMGEWYHLIVPMMLARHRGTENYGPTVEQLRLHQSPKITAVHQLLSLPIVLPVFVALVRWRLGVFDPLQRFVEEQRPDIVLHPSVLAGYFVNDLTLVCQRLGIPLVLLMNSWDNPSCKAITTGVPDRLVVWGTQTRAHAVKYLGVPEDRIEMFGAAQFQIYRRPVTQSRAELCSLFKVPDNTPILLYAGASKSVNEAVHLQLIDGMIERGRIPRCHVLYRPHPWRGRLVEGEPSLYELELKNVSLDPFMEDYYQAITKGELPGFFVSDYEHTWKLMNMIDALISPLSTMLLEAIIHGKPVLALFAGAEADTRGAKIVDIVRRLVYFAEFMDCPGIFTCDDLERLADCCAELLQGAGDPGISEGLKRHANKFVVMDGPTYGERLNDLADRLVQAAA